MKIPPSPMQVIDLDAELKRIDRTERRHRRWWWRAWYRAHVEVQLLHLRSVLWALRRVDPAAAEEAVVLLLEEVHRNG